jgi:hypothetical protein
MNETWGIIILLTLLLFECSINYYSLIRERKLNIRISRMDREIKSNRSPKKNIPVIPNFVLTELKDMMEELGKKVECPICFEDTDPQDISFGKCGHKFCSGCMTRLKTQGQGHLRNKCPMCRSGL